MIPHNLVTYPFGAGLGTGGPAISAPGASQVTLAHPPDIETKFSFLTVETGIAGMIALVGFTLSVLVIGFRRFRLEPDREARALLAALIAPVAGIFVVFFTSAPSPSALPARIYGRWVESCRTGWSRDRRRVVVPLWPHRAGEPRRLTLPARPRPWSGPSNSSRRRHAPHTTAASARREPSGGARGQSAPLRGVAAAWLGPVRRHAERLAQPICARAVRPEVLPELAGPSRARGSRCRAATWPPYLTAVAKLIADVAPGVAFIEEEPTSIPSFQWGYALRRAGVPFGVQAAENLDRPWPLPARAFRHWTLAHASFVAARSPAAAELVRRRRPGLSSPVIPHHVPAWPDTTRVHAIGSRSATPAGCPREGSRCTDRCRSGTR